MNSCVPERSLQNLAALTNYMKKEKLLLLHGALGSKKQFNSLTRELTNSNNVYTLNFEGHGGKPGDEDFSIELFTRNVIEFLDHNTIDNINIFGYSMGGYVALNTALNIPGKISKISTLGTKFKWDVESAEKEVKMLDPVKVEEKVPQFAKKLEEVHHPLDWKTVMNKTAKMMMKMGEGAKLTDQDLKQIKIPVTIGIGSLDKMVTLEESEMVSKLIPGAQLIKLNGVKHPIETIETKQLIDYIVSN